MPVMMLSLLFVLCPVQHVTVQLLEGPLLSTLRSVEVERPELIQSLAQPAKKLILRSTPPRELNGAHFFLEILPIVLIHARVSTCNSRLGRLKCGIGVSC